MKNRTLVGLPVLALVGFLAIKPPAIGNDAGPIDGDQPTTSSSVEVVESPTQSKKVKSNSSQEAAQENTKAGSLTAGITSGETFEELGPVTTTTESAPLVAPPEIRGDDDDDDDDDDHDDHDDHDDDDDDHREHRHHDDD